MAYGLAELRAVLGEVDGRAVLVEGSILRGLIARLSGRRWGRSGAHRKCLVVETARLGAGDMQGVWPEGMQEGLCPAGVSRVLLIEAPDGERLGKEGEWGAILLRTWRLLFHASVHAYLEMLLERGALTASVVQARVHGLGRSAFDEAQAVLREEEMLLPGVLGDDVHVYIEFVATYLEFKFFSPHLLQRYFGNLDEAHVDAVLEKDISGLSLYWEARLPGASSSLGEEQGEAREDNETEDFEAIEDVRVLEGIGEVEASGQAMGGERRGNQVRALLVWRWMGRDEERRRVQRGFAARLATHFGETEGVWDGALEGIWGAHPASSRGVTAKETQFLFDLQKACVDSERVAMALDGWGWVRSRLSGGRSALQQKMPLLGKVRVVGHLGRALKKCVGLHGLDERAHGRLKKLVEGAWEEARERVRGELRPIVGEALDGVGFVFGTRVEREARQKLVEELLDRVEHEGFLRMSDVRDAIARNLCKLSNIKTVGQWWRDPLLVMDKQLRETARGVYRGGEIYLRGLQRVSAVGFGTGPGRWLILWVVLPLLGAFVVLEGLEHTVGVLLGKVGLRVHFTGGMWRVWVLAVVVWGLIHSERFRRGVWTGAKWVGTAIKTVCVVWPRLFVKWPPVKAFLDTALWRALRDWGVLPAVVAVGLVGLLGLFGVRGWGVWGVGLGVGFGTSGVLASKWWRVVRVEVIDWLLMRWKYTIQRLLPGMLQWLLDVFRRLMLGIERVLYRVDEWLRFRDGDKAWLVPLKAVAGAIWAVLAYVVRLYINLLVEPQVNPIKHFPVVTVSHKMILPFTVDLVRLLAAVLKPILGGVVGGTLATVTVILLPGVFGFLVWEFKENWRLYEQNRADRLKPVLVGAHGEDMGRMLRLGFHSGTIPRLYAKLRRAERKRAIRGVARSLRKHQESLVHVAHEIKVFVERDVVALLCAHLGWPRPALSVGEVFVSSHQVVICLEDGLGGESVKISVREQHQWLIGRVEDRGWIKALDTSARKLLGGALAGFYHQAGVQLVQEHYLQAFEDQASAPGQAPLLDHHINGGFLVVWRGLDYLDESQYPLREVPTKGAAIPLARLRFDLHPIGWRDWVAFWERDSVQADNAQADGAQADNTQPEISPNLIPHRG